MIFLAVLNGIVSLGSVGFAVVAAVRPSALSHVKEQTTGQRFYAWMYTARGVPLGVLAGVVPFFPHGAVSALALIAAAVAQAGDIAIGAQRRDARMIAGATLVCVVHVVTAIAVL